MLDIPVKCWGGGGIFLVHFDSTLGCCQDPCREFKAGHSGERTVIKNRGEGLSTAAVQSALSLLRGWVRLRLEV